MNDGPGPADPQAKLAAVVAKASAPPEPPSWVQRWQMIFAGLLFITAMGLAFYLVAEGPPAPKAPDAATEASDSESTKEEPTAAAFLTAEAEPLPEDGGGEAGEGETEEGETEEGPSEEGESEEESGASLASLNEQAPWAFAIVALLVGAFLATGKNLSFAGVSGGTKGTKNGN
ncbi:MAG TPA: hypothetical protein VFN18_06800 [Solirubrobacterales bacterium]|nr:hypothetical protein [Solirubrobacterales bacterium]